MVENGADGCVVGVSGEFCADDVFCGIDVVSEWTSTVLVMSLLSASEAVSVLHWIAIATGFELFVEEGGWGIGFWIADVVSVSVDEVS